MLLGFSFVSIRHPSWTNGTAIGFMNALIMGAGAVFQPLIGYLVDRAADHQAMVSVNDYQEALLVLPACLVIALIILFCIEAPKRLTASSH